MLTFFAVTRISMTPLAGSFPQLIINHEMAEMLGFAAKNEAPTTPEHRVFLVPRTSSLSAKMVTTSPQGRVTFLRGSATQGIGPCVSPTH